MLSFEKVRDLERAESSSRDLGKLPEQFIDDLRDYIKRKEKTSEEREMKNIQSTIKRLFELREKKILELALYSAKTKMPVENLTKIEEKTFNNLLLIIKNHRQSFFESMENESVKQQRQQDNEKKADTKNIKEVSYIVKKTLKPFVGPDLNLYNLKENDIIGFGKLPKPLNDLLLKEGVIEKVEK